MQRPYILWLGPVVNESAVISSPAVSPAGNRWQLGLIHALQQMDIAVRVIGHLPEPVWPRGRLRVKPQDERLPHGVQGQLTGYWNLPAWRNRSLSNGYRKLIRQIVASGAYTGVVVTYNGSPANVAGATYARKRYSVPWICIVADDDAPPDADGYVFLSWWYYETFAEAKPKLHLDGGIFEIPFSPQTVAHKNPTRGQVVMYTGAMSSYGGVDFLVRAFHKLVDPHVELWICGKGSNPEVKRLAAIDDRIKVWGFVPEERLNQLMQQADVFVNPRPSKILGNERNFPSKILEYLSYGRPVISTLTEGLSPQYRDVLIGLEQETEECLAATIQDVLNWQAEQRQFLAQRVARFLESRLWHVQATRLVDWMAQVSIDGKGR